MTKVVFVSTEFMKKKEMEKKKIPAGVEKSGLFGLNKKQVYEEIEIESEKEIVARVDGKKLERKLEKTINDLAQNGYQIKSVTPVTSGYKQKDTFWKSNAKTDGYGAGWGYGYGGGWGYGFSWTEGMLVIASKED